MPAEGAPPLAGEGTGERFAVLGVSGSGKTTLATRLAARLHLPFVELDALRWGPNWTPATDAVFRARVDAALGGGGGWVADGNYAMARDLIWPRAGAIIWLDYSLPLVLIRLIRRSLRRVLTGERLWAGNRELWRLHLSKDSVILWALRSHGKHRREYPALLRKPEFAHLRVIRLRSPRAAERWLATIRPTRS